MNRAADVVGEATVRRLLPLVRVSPEDGERFMSKVSPEPNTGCWLWTGAAQASGYGRIWIGGVVHCAHRVAFVMAGGVLNDRLRLDHLCRQRCCVNPAHLEQVTERVNILRGTGQSARNIQKTHCKWGHELSGANVYVGPSKPHWRYCRTCAVIRSMNRDRRRS